MLKIIKIKQQKWQNKEDFFCFSNGKTEKESICMELMYNNYKLF